MKQSFYARFSAYYETIFPFRKSVFRLLKSEAPYSGCGVVDLGCGPGHYCNAFQELGYKALGLDLDRDMIAAAKKKYPESIFICANILDINTIHPMGMLVYCIGNVLSHLSKAQIQKWAVQLAECSTPGTKLVIQTVNWDSLNEKLPFTFPPLCRDQHNMRFSRQYIPIDEERVSFMTSLEADHSKLWKNKVTMYPILSYELENRLNRSHWKTINIWGDYGQTAFKPKDSPAFIGVFEKDQ